MLSGPVDVASAEIVQYWDDPADDVRGQEGTLMPLWEFSSSAAKHRQVTAICWNPQYSDLFAGMAGLVFIRHAPSYAPCVVACQACTLKRRIWDAWLEAEDDNSRSVEAMGEGYHKTDLHGTHLTGNVWLLPAVGYGSYDFQRPTTGVVCCYTLKNPSHAEATFATAAGGRRCSL